LISKKVGDTDYRLSVIPLGGYVKLFGENPNDEVPPELEPYSFLHHSLWHRFLIVMAGPGFNLLFSILILFLIFSLSGIPYLTTEIGGTKPDSPAAAAGLQKGDRILTVNGQPVDRWEKLAALIRDNGERPLAMSLQRNGQELQVVITPKKMESTNIFGEKVSAVLIGVSAGDQMAVDEVDPITALSEGTAYTFRIAILTVQSLYKLVVRDIPINTLGGPIMIAQVAGKQAEQGVNYLIHFMAVLSVNLALLNLLPIPILDGGHIFFLLWEALRGKPVAVKHRELAQAMGMMFILALMVLVFYYDLLRLFTPQP
jgi:regulator of sigma E protease